MQTDQALAKNYLVLAAVFLALFSLILLFLPYQLTRLLSINASATGALFMQFLGASLAGHAYLNWQARRYELATIRLVYRMNIVALALAVLISLVAISATAYSKVYLLILLMHLVFLSGFLIIMKRLPA